MAFVLNDFVPLSSMANSNAPRWWAYASADDAVAVIGASAYFNEVARNLQVGDVIHTVDSANVSTLHNVLTVTPDVTVSAGTAIA